MGMKKKASSLKASKEITFEYRRVPDNWLLIEEQMQTGSALKKPLGEKI